MVTHIHTNIPPDAKTFHSMKGDVPRDTPRISRIFGYFRYKRLYWALSLFLEVLSQIVKVLRNI